MGNCVNGSHGDTHFQSRYKLESVHQAQALKMYVGKLKIPRSLVDIVYARCNDSSLEIGGHYIHKTEFLSTYKVDQIVDKCFENKC